MVEALNLFALEKLAEEKMPEAGLLCQRRVGRGHAPGVHPFVRPFAPNGDSSEMLTESLGAWSFSSVSRGELAPEVGLEPTTSRLTAARSTIELLWNAEERAIYKPGCGASN